jgi:hypothetical protein
VDAMEEEGRWSRIKNIRVPGLCSPVTGLISADFLIIFVLVVPNGHNWDPVPFSGGWSAGHFVELGNRHRCVCAIG